MTDRLLPPNRRPIVIADSRLRAGARSARVGTDDPEALLRQYLRLIRRVRKQQRHRSVALRRADIAALAVHLDWTDDEVLARLADLMGATRRQRAAMLAVLATGASLITITTPAAAATPGSTGVPGRHEAPVVVLADHLAASPTVTANEHAGRLTGPDAGTPAGRQAPVLAAQARRTAPPAPSLYVGKVFAGSTVPQSQPSAAQTVPDTGTETGIDAVGNLVATGPPPLPPTTETETGIDALGNLVATGPPPVPVADTVSGPDDPASPPPDGA